jgi:protein-tyrosine phosphatase
LIYWIQDGRPPRFAIVARPEGGERLRDDLAALRSGGIDILISFLPPDEAEYLGLADEARLAARVGLEFISYPVLDRTVPEDIAGFRALIDRLAAEVRAGKRVGAHCRGCIGRSTVLIASLMIALGSDAETALDQIERARGFEVPDTPEQCVWIFNFQPAADRPS